MPVPTKQYSSTRLVMCYIPRYSDSWRGILRKDRLQEVVNDDPYADI